MANKKNRRKKKKQDKKYFYRRLCAVMIILFAVWHFNNYSLKITKTSYTTSKVSAPVKLAVLGDHHIHSGGISPSKILRAIDRIKPDAVVILGDMYSRNATEKNINNALELMGDIAAEYPSYFVPGDHDVSAQYHAAVGEKGVHVLKYRTEEVMLNGQPIRFLGIDNVYFTPSFDLHNEFYIDPGYCNILLAHIPNYEKYADFGADLTLCADTHGGLLRLPFIGPVCDSLTSVYFPELKGERVFDKGWFPYDGGAMFITSGIGDSPFPVRFCNRPEVVSLEILPQ